MVSFWPWKGGDTSAASFEKLLSQLSTKINTASARNDSFRQHQRRYKVLWTLYTSFVYILVALIFLLVTGWQKWGALEYTAVAGGPVLIYGVRTALDAYYNYRIAGSQAHLNDLQKQREAAIEKLKTATKYNSTQQLLEKYGGSPPSAKSSPQATGKRKSIAAQGKPGTPQQRTGIAPPPTANIPSRQPAPPPQPGSRPTSADLSNHLGLPPPREAAPNEDFAPNAFSVPPPPQRQISQYASDGPKWYDRILDVVLGEDERQPKNRIALICESCRLVNGQSPPGARTVEDIGRWKCSACGAWNGVEGEAQKMLQMARNARADGMASPTSPSSATATAEEEGAAAEEEHDTESEEVDETPPAGSTRSKSRQRKKG